jgi:hypothetical protein
MSTILTKAQIRSLYGVTDPKSEVVAFGARLVNKPTHVLKHRAPTLDDFGTSEYNDRYDRQNKLRETPAAPEIRSDVTELTF